MKNIFGFIDYHKTKPSLASQSEDKIIHFREHKEYNLFLSYTIEKETHLIEENHITLLFSGTLLNREEILIQLSTENTSISLTKLLLKGYKKWGIKLFSKLEGTFILLIHNKQENSLILAKDKIGIVPINFYISKNIIIFGSRVTQFAQAPSFTPVVSPEGLANYLQFGYIIQPHSIFEGCYKVKSGEFTKFNLNTKEYESHAHWKLEDAYHNPKLFPDEPAIKKSAQQLLTDTIHKVEIEGNTVALSLSGGYDSSTLAALLSKKFDYKVSTYTIGFEDHTINEAPDAKKIAKYLGTDHHEHYFTAKDATRIIPQLAKIYDEPFADHAASPTLMTNELIELDGQKDLFVGDGGDEVFATADDVHFFERIQSLPYTVRSRLLAPLKKLKIDRIPYLKEFHNFPTKYEKFLHILSAKNIPQMTEGRNILFREKELNQMIKGHNKPIVTTFNEINFNGYQETVDEIIGTYFKTSMIDGELVKSYSASQHHGITIKTPFLDEKLIAYIAKVPSSIKIKDGIKKYLLKEIAYQYIPKPLLDRPKSGFDIPFGIWMKKELKELLNEQINKERLDNDNIFHTSTILNIKDKFYNGNENYKYKLWRIFIFQLWYENFKNINKG